MKVIQHGTSLGLKPPVCAEESLGQRLGFIMADPEITDKSATAKHWLKARAAYLELPEARKMFKRLDWESKEAEMRAYLSSLTNMKP